MKALLAVLALLIVGSSACATSQPNDIGCALCKIGFGTIEDLISQNDTEQAIEWLLGQICNLFPEPQKTSCHNVVMWDIKYIIEMVKKVESPQEICCQLGACPAPCPVIDVPCAMCEFLMTDVERWVEDGKGKEEIEKLLDAWCDILPSSAQPVCKKITDIGVGTLIDMIIKYQNPHVVCVEITICNETAVPVKLPTPILPPLPTGTAGCQWCKIGFGVLEELLSMNYTETGIEFLLGYLCNFFPNPEQQAACHTVVMSDIKEIIAAFKKYESPEELCCQVGACDNSSCPFPPADIGCDICQFLMGDLDKWLEQGKGAEEIAHLIDAWCKILPDTAQGTCKAITDIGIEALIELMIKYQDPHTVCFELKECATSKL